MQNWPIGNGHATAGYQPLDQTFAQEGGQVGVQQREILIPGNNIVAVLAEGSVGYYLLREIDPKSMQGIALKLRVVSGAVRQLLDHPMEDSRHLWPN